MSMSNRKRFNNVSVGDGNFLVQLSSTRPPEVLVLSARPPRHRCHNENPLMRSRSCKSCCLQTDKWISEDGRPRRECFECGPRRSIDFELKAYFGQPNGKLMILALKQLLKSPSEQPFKCNTSTTWTYYKKANSTVSIGIPGQTYYISQAGSYQVPKLRIKSLELSWSQSDKHELVSLQFEPSSHVPAHHHQQVVYAKETLVVVELYCYQTPPNSTKQSIRASSPTPLHLLALIDPQQLNQRESRLDEAPTKPELLHGRQHHQANNEIAPKQHEYTTSSMALPIDTTGQSSINSGTELASLEASTTTVKSVLLTASIPALNRTQHRFHLLATEFELIRDQLRENGVLFLVLLSLAAVILIYTLCLFLKPCGKSAISKSCEKRKRKRKCAEKYQQPASMRISKPFNLQMPPATQTRLEAMMGLSSRFSVPLDCGTGRRRLVPCSGGGWRILGAVPHPAAAVAVVAKANRRQTKQLVAQYQARQQRPSGLIALKQTPATNQLPDLSRGTFKMVRNLRSAATLARSRLKQSAAYQSNLHAIPELDLEHQHQYQHLSVSSMFKIQTQVQQPRHPAADQCLNYNDKNQKRESVVYDALNNDCSQLVSKYNVLSQVTANATLFSKPDKLTCASLATPSTTANSSDNKSTVQVSRSRILKQVKLHE